MAFSWANHQIKTENRLLRRITQLAKVNPDFQVSHPELVKEVSANTTSVERKKFVDKLVRKKRKYGAVPKPSVIVKRYNRVA